MRRRVTKQARLERDLSDAQRVYRRTERFKPTSPDEATTRQALLVLAEQRIGMIYRRLVVQMIRAERVRRKKVKTWAAKRQAALTAQGAVEA
jgi:hypothetical protein